MAASRGISSATCMDADLFMVVSPPEGVRILATAASTTSLAPAGAWKITSNVSSPETLPRVQTRAPGSVPLPAAEPSVPTRARAASIPAASRPPPACAPP
ncbi:hypothetical protein [Nonomuraea sp. NPDC052265]|uniref:hypothetical protein n=1 Tax=Nonomuraea sp. NPDC052265 TaxID=3364374 RepID=UPI0037CA4B1A